MSNSLIFGAIADDYTGGSDLAGMLAQQGVRTVQLLGLPSESLVSDLAGRYQAAVFCLKSRSIPAPQACEMSLRAFELLQRLAPAQVEFKYCSTFDSTPEGNIGAVTAALMDRLGADFTVAIPALPVNGRTQYYGYLYVGSLLLSDSHMRHHPLNPMTEPNLVRHLQRQTERKVGLIPLPVVRQGREAILAHIDRLKADGVRIALVDAIEDSDLCHAAEAIVDLPLITGGSGIAEKLPPIWKRRGLLAGQRPAPPKLEASPGTLVLSGSCSAATLAQLDDLARRGHSGIAIDVPALLRDSGAEIERCSDAAAGRIHATGLGLVYSSAAPETRESLLAEARRLGRAPEEVPQAIECAMGRIARRIVDRHRIARVVVAGGETSGAVVDALEIPAVEVLDILDPGVPALFALGSRPMGLALKSGNFGSIDFFDKAVRYLEAM